MVEIFAGALSGGACIREKPINQLGNCVFEIIIDPKHIGGGEHFAREVQDLVKFIRDCPRTEGVNEILLPGDPERKPQPTKNPRHAAGRWQLGATVEIRPETQSAGAGREEDLGFST